MKTLSVKLDPSELFKALAVGTRVNMIDLLKTKGPLGVKNISEVLSITPAAVSQHLKVLKHAGLVKSERKGYWVPYSIDEQALENCRCILAEVCTCGCKGAGKSQQRAVNETSLASLVKYEKELKKELQEVRERISQVRGGKK